MDYSLPGFPVLQYLPEFAQTHVHWVGDAIQPSHSLSSFSPPAFSLSQHQALSHFFASGGQRIGDSASTSVLPMSVQDWFPLGLTGWISLQSKGLSRVLQHHSLKVSILQRSAFFVVQLSHSYITTGKTIALIYRPLLAEWCLCFLNMLSRFVIAFLPRSKHLLISWLQSTYAVILEPKKIKYVTASMFSFYLL